MLCDTDCDMKNVSTKNSEKHRKSLTVRPAICLFARSKLISFNFHNKQSEKVADPLSRIGSRLHHSNNPIGI